MANTTKLDKASLVALRDYMGISSDETLLVVTDDNKREIGLSLFNTGKKICKEVIYLEIKPRDINGEEPPGPVADIMKAVDVVICPTTKSLTHTNARREASKLGVRVGTMPGITVDTMTRCMAADYDKVVDTTFAVAEKFKRISNIRVTTKTGTDITLPVRNRRAISSTGVLRKIGESGNLPSGEVYIAPWEGKSNGIIVFDGSIAGIGLLENPVTVEVKDGFIESITGKNEAKLFEHMLESVGRDAFAVAEFGIGTNYKAKLCGDILEDEKVLGTIHIAFGNNLSMGGKISVQSHIDGLVKKPTVYFDDFMILDNGKLTIEVEEKAKEEEIDD